MSITRPPGGRLARALLVGLVALAACRADIGSTASGSALSPSDIGAVRALSDEYARAWLADDTAAVLGVFTNDAALVPHLGNPHVVGREAIRRHFWPPGTAPAPVFRYDRESLEVNGAGDVAWDRGTYALGMVFQGDTIRNAGNYLAVARRGEDGRWRWSAYTWNHR